jgi:uncharacterized protein YoxC
MELTMTISVAVIAAIMVVGVLCLIPVLFQIRRTAQQVEKTLETARMQIVPVSHDLTIISQEVNGIIQSIHRQVDKIEDSVTTVRDGAERLREFEEDMVQRIEEPFMEMATLLSAVTRGVETFFRLLRR